MGESKKKVRAVIAEQPTCTYCGGESASTSVDHCPPIAIFDARQRPKGLEFGACAHCHQGTREMDAVASFVSRIYGTKDSPETRREMANATRQMFIRYRRLIQKTSIEDERVSHRDGFGHRLHIEKGNGLHTALEGFSARLGLALYRHHKGNAAPSTARIAGQWRTNVDLDEDTELDTIIRSLGLPHTIQQGEKHVFDQFRYWILEELEEPNIFGCVAVFRESFGIVSFIDTREMEPTFEPAFRPGFLRGFSF